MSLLMPTPLFVVAGIAAFALVAPRLNRPTSAAHLAAEAFAVGALTCLGFAAAWALYWWIEQRW